MDEKEAQDYATQILLGLPACHRPMNKQPLPPTNGEIQAVDANGVIKPPATQRKFKPQTKFKST